MNEYCFGEIRVRLSGNYTALMIEARRLESLEAHSLITSAEEYDLRELRMFSSDSSVIRGDIRAEHISLRAEVERLKEKAEAKTEEYKNTVATWMTKYGDKAAECHELSSDFEALRDEMKAIAFALGRSKTDGESDCDWHDLAGDVEQIMAERDKYKAALDVAVETLECDIRKQEIAVILAAEAVRG